MKFSFDGNLIRAKCSLEDNDLFRRAGFAWVSASGEWVTPLASVAIRASAPQEIVSEKVKKEKASYQASFAVGPDIHDLAPSESRCLPYQVAGVNGLISRVAALLADDMGLGKTIQVIVAVSSLYPILTPTKILIVCPAGLKINWLREWAKWDKTGLAIGIAEGKEWPDTPVVVINYEILEKHKERLDAVEWDVIVCDETHYLKNPESTRTQMVFGGGKKKHAAIQAKYKWLLTGTPVLNRPIELYPLLKYLSPYMFPDKFRFARRYCAATFDGFSWNMSGASNLEELQRVLRATVMIRRTKAQVLTQLPPKRRQVIEIKPKSLKKQNKILEMFFGKDEPKSPETLTDEEFRKLLLRVSSGNGAGFETVSKVMRETAEEKIPAVLEHVRECLAAEQKLVVFCHHKVMVDALREEFKSISVRVTGSESSAEKQYNVDKFQKRHECRLLIGNIKAAGVGLTLTAAKLAVFAERTWVPGEIMQAEDRLHRIGQVNPVLIQHLVLADSIDAYMARAIVQKMYNIEKAQDNAFGAGLMALLA